MHYYCPSRSIYSNKPRAQLTKNKRFFAYELAFLISNELKIQTNGIYGRRVCIIIGSRNRRLHELIKAITFLRFYGILSSIILLDPICINEKYLCKFQQFGGQIVSEISTNIDLVIDAIVDISKYVNLKSHFISMLNAHLSPILSIDIPSGIDGQTGFIESFHINANLTAVFEDLKPVHTLAQCGRIKQLNSKVNLNPTYLAVLEAADIRSYWPIPKSYDDKYTQGVTGIFAGSRLYPGAAILTSGAAVIATSGMVRYSGSATQQIALHWPEVITTPTLEENGLVQAWIIGPGIGMSNNTKKTTNFLFKSDKPLIVDADALSIIAEDINLILERNSPTIITPHLKEYKRFTGHLFGVDRVAAARSLAKSLNVVVLLKGKITVISEPYGVTYINNSDHSWSATAGSGDILSGIIGALLSSGLTAIQAAVTATFIHTKAACIAASSSGLHSVPTSASHIISCIKPAITSILGLG